MKNLTKKGKIIALISALALVCITSGVTMYATGVLPSHSHGEMNISYECTDSECSCHETFSGHNSCNHCHKCRGEAFFL